MAVSSPWARRARCRATRRSSAPISEARHDGRRPDPARQQHRDLLWADPGDPQRLAAGSAGRHRHGAWRQWRRQDDDPQDHFRRHGSGGRRGHFRRPRHQAHDARSRHAARHRPCAGRPRDLPVPDRPPEPVDGRLHPARPGWRRPGYRDVFRLLPGAARARQAARRAAVGRRAADAGDQSRADGQASSAAARRAFAWAVAHPGHADFRDRAPYQSRAGRFHPARRAECAHRAQGRGLWLHHRGGPHRSSGHLRQASRAGGHQGILSRPEGRRGPWRAALEEEEAVAVMDSQGHMPDTAPTIPAMLYGQVERYGPESVMRRKDRGIWKSTSWSQLGAVVRRGAMALKATGFRAGDVACILADTSPAWVTTDLGILCAGGISAGIYTTDTLEQIRFVINDSRCRIVFVGNEEQLDKVLEVRGECPLLSRIVIFDMTGLRDFSDPMAESLESFLTRGETRDASHPREWDESLAALRPNDGAVLTYTSGMSAAPKGVLLSHRNVLFQVGKAAAL